jgi:hypothetical protein
MSFTIATTIFHALLAVILLTQLTPVTGIFPSRCPNAISCGRSGLFYVMHTGAVGTPQCREYCVFFQNVTLQCGNCTRSAGTVPVRSPTARTPTAPVRSPTAPVPIAPVLSSQYDISLSLVGIPSTDVSIFTNAASRWESIVVGDLKNVSSRSLQYTLSSGCTVPTTIDDLHICARYDYIDGPKKVLGSAGPYDTRSSNFLTVTGEMEFDSSDISYLKGEGNFASVILHEMGHILGMYQ